MGGTRGLVYDPIHKFVAMAPMCFVRARFALVATAEYLHAPSSDACEKRHYINS